MHVPALAVGDRALDGIQVARPHARTYHTPPGAPPGILSHPPCAAWEPDNPLIAGCSRADLRNANDWGVASLQSHLDGEGACTSYRGRLHGADRGSTKCQGDSWLRRSIRPTYDAKYDAKAGRFTGAPGYLYSQHFLDALQDKNVRFTHPNPDILTTFPFTSPHFLRSVLFFDTFSDISAPIVQIVQFFDT